MDGLESLQEKFHLEDSRKRAYNVKMDLKEIGWECVDWIHLAQVTDRRRAVVNK
jgi:hypothetical protein